MSLSSIYNSLKKFASRNQGLVISAVIAFVMIFWFYGCESQTQSLIEPTRKVTETQLEIEYSSELARLEAEMTVLKTNTEIRLHDLRRQDKFKQALYENAKLIAEGTNPNPLGILSLVGSLFGIGAIIDNRRKDGLIQALKRT